MPSPAQQRAREHYRRQQAVTAAAVLAARKTAQTAKNPAARLAAVAGVVARYQLLSAVRATATLAAEHGGTAVTNPVAFAGVTAMGFSVTDPLTVIFDRYARAAAAAALENRFAYEVERFVASEVADAGRGAAHVETVVTPGWTNYVRVLVLPSCSRCVPLAGRIYHDLEEFERHDLCDCQMWPVTDPRRALADGLVADPVEAVRSGQVRGLSKDDTQAILDGADVGQVINARRGMRTVNLFGRDAKITLEGTTKRGVFGGHTAKGRAEYTVEKIGKYGYVKNQTVRRAKAPRLRPETIYANAKDRDDAIRLLKVYGYILPTTP